MARVAIIGGTGHVGTYLVPRLVHSGHEVLSISRGESRPYRDHLAWEAVEQVRLDREAREAAGDFGERVRALRPDVVIDMICFELESARQLVEARRRGFPATVLHPGHIVGPGWVPVNPAGNFDPEVFGVLARGEELALPNLGMETVHHVHADDVAQAFERALASWNAAVGESFHVVSPAALTLRGYAEAIAGWFGRAARLRFVPWEQWREEVSEDDAAATWDHIAHSPNCRIRKASRALDYRPRYGSLQAVGEAVAWMMEHEMIAAG